MLYLLLIIPVIAIFLWLMLSVRPRIKERKRAKQLELFNQLKPEVEKAFSEIKSLYSFSHYITETERLSLLDDYRDLDSEVRPLLNSKEIEEYMAKDVFRRFHKAMTDTKEHKKSNNHHFVENQLSSCSEYFDTILTYPLDPQQREAVVSLEDNVLVISSAGSGKTMTTVGKVRYLIDKQHVPAEKILLITFTRKAAQSLSERLGEKKLKCRTFHKLALDIIGEATGKKPSLTDADSFPKQVYYKLYEESQNFRTAISDYIIRSRYTMKDQFEYASREAYMIDRQKHGLYAYFKDMDGRSVFCKSDEECQICDFLGARGIKFRYEENYEIDTADSEHRQYKPDFSIYIDDQDGTQRRIYLEHFAVNEEDRCPQWFSQEEELNYLNGRRWKRQLHIDSGTTLIETSSGDFHRGDVFEKLSAQLQELGAVFSNATSDKVSKELHQQEENILAMLTSFIFLMKSRNASLDSIRQIVSGKDRFVLNEIIAPYVQAYQDLEEEFGEIDFTDAIIQATDLCNNGQKPDYDYILVDEFQDISLDRYRFLQSLRREKPLTKLFCVGDDWQSIYRFAGSDMALFKQFEKYFGYTKKCLMETTYRFGEPAIEESSRFILANPEQAVKSVRSFSLDAETKLDFLATNGYESIADTIQCLADQIPADKEILLLGRYHFDVNVLKNTSLSVHETKDKVYVTYGRRKMNFMTVHQSKGLECDYIILLNCNGGTIGFPSQISDSPILKYVLSEPDVYAFSEERRVFYVGITRAKKHTWVLYDINKPSPFVMEFVQTLNPDIKPGADIPEPERCPKCHCGRIKVVKTGKAVNGNPYSVLTCSNEKYGCDYRETKFVNLNSTYRASRKKIGF